MPTQDFPEALTAHAAAAGVDEDGVVASLRQLRAEVAQVASGPVLCGRSDRHESFLLTFAQDDQEALADADLHGWAIIKQIGTLTEGKTKPSTGSLYLAMVKLEDKGLIADAPLRDADDDPRRRYYTLTRLGRRVLQAETQRLSLLVNYAKRAGVSTGRPAKS